MRALSLTQPWAWLVANGRKPLENRKWSTKFRGPFLIHASKGMTRKQYDAAREFARLYYPTPSDAYLDIPPRGLLERGGIVGRAELFDVVPPCSEWPCKHAWHMKSQFGFLLRNIEPLDFVPLKGMLGFFECVSFGGIERLGER